MADKTISVSLDFTANTNQAENALQSLQGQLRNISNMSTIGQDASMSKKIEEASAAAMKLRQNLQAAFDQKTGQLNLSKLNEEMAKSGMSAEKYRMTLSAIGPEGRHAFMQLSNAVIASQTSLRQTSGLVDKLWGSLKRTAGWQLSSSMIHGFMGAVQSAYGYAQDLNKSLNNIRIVTGMSTDEMSRFADQANKAAKGLSTTTTNYTDAALIYYQQGIRDQGEIEERVATTIKLANVTGQSAEEVSSQMTAIWNNFDDGSQSLEHYADVITALGAATASSSAEIAQGLQKFAAVAETVGMSYEYATSALATIVATTRQSADTVGTGLRTLFSRLQGLKLGETLDDGTDLNKYSQALETVGVSIKDASGQLKDMDTILDELGSRWQTLTKDQQVALAQTVGGVRQYTNLIALMDNWGFMQQNLGVAEGADGTLQEQADIYAESWEGAQKRVQASAEAIYQHLIDDKFFIKLTNMLADVLDLIDRMVNAFGGLGGVLPLILSLMNRIFGERMQESMSAAMSNIYFGHGKGKQIQAAADEETKQAFINQQKVMATENVGGENEAAANAIGYEKIAKMQQNLVANNDTLTEQEKLLQQMAIERAQALTDQAASIGRQADEAKNLVNEQKQDMIWSPPDLASMTEKMKQTGDALMPNPNSSLIIAGSKDLEQLAEYLQQVNGSEELNITTVGQLYTEYQKFSQSLQGIFTGDLAQDLNNLETMFNQNEASMASNIQFANELDGAMNNLPTDFNAAKGQLNSFIQVAKNMEGDIGATARAIERELGNKTINSTKAVRTAFERLQASVGKTNAQMGRTAREVAQAIGRAYGFSEKEIQEFTKKLEDSARKQQEAKTSADGLNGSLNNLQNAGSSAGAGLERAGMEAALAEQRINMTGVSIQKLGQFSMNVSMLINSFQGLKNAINNPDLSGWEQFTSVLMSFGMMIGAATSMVTNLKTAMGGLNAVETVSVALKMRGLTATLLNIGATKAQAAAQGAENTEKTKETILTALNTAGIKGETAAKFMEILATKGLAAAMAFLNTQMVTFLTTILPIIAIIAVVVIAFKALKSAFEEQPTALEKAEDKLKQTQEAVKGLAEVYNEATEAVNNFNESLNNYDTAVEGLNGLKKGTVEYQAQVAKANEEASKLISSLSNLTDMNGKPIEIDYRVNKDGLIEIDDETLKQGQQALQLKQAATRMSLDFGKLQEAKAQYEVDVQKFLKDDNSYQVQTGTKKVNTNKGAAFGARDSSDYKEVAVMEDRKFFSEDQLQKVLKELRENEDFLDKFGSNNIDTIKSALSSIDIDLDDEKLKKLMEGNVIPQIIALSQSLDRNTAALTGQQIADTRAMLEAGSAEFASFEDKDKNAVAAYALSKISQQDAMDFADSFTRDDLNYQVAKYLQQTTGQNYKLEYTGNYTDEGKKYETRQIYVQDASTGEWKLANGGQEYSGSQLQEMLAGMYMGQEALKSMPEVLNQANMVLRDNIGRQGPVRWDKNTDEAIFDENVVNTGVDLDSSVLNAMAYAASNDGKGAETFDMTSLLGSYSNTEIARLRELTMNTAVSEDGQSITNEGADELVQKLGLTSDRLKQMGYDSSKDFAEAFYNGLTEINPEEVTEALGDAAALEGSQYGLDPEYVKELTAIHEEEYDAISGMPGMLEATGEAAIDAAVREARLNKAVEELSTNYKDYKDIITALGKAQDKNDRADIKRKDAYKKLKTVMADLLNVTEDLVDDDFMSKIDPADLQAAANGNEEAVKKIARDFTVYQGELVGYKEEAAAFADQIASMDVGESIDMASLLNENEFIQALLRMSSSAADFEARMAGMHIDLDMEPIRQSALAAEQAALQAGETIVDATSFDTEAVTGTAHAEGMAEEPAYDVEWVPGQVLPITNTVMTDSQDETGHEVVTSYTPVSKKVTFNPKKEEVTEDDPIVAYKVSNGHKTSGGNISSSNKGNVGGKGGGGGGGGSKKTKEAPKADRGARYHNVTRRASNTSRRQTENNRRKDRAFGKAQVELAREDLEIQKKKIELQEEYTKEISKNLKEDREEMKRQFDDLKLPINFEFDEDGEIKNYQDVIDALFEKEKALVNQYNAGGLDDEAFDEAKKKLDEAKEALGNYEETLELQKDELQTLEEYMEELADKALELTQIKFELNMSIIEDQLEWLDYSLTKLEDDAYGAAKAIALMGQQTAQYLKQGETAQAAIMEILGRHGIESIEQLNGLSDQQIEALGFNKDEIEELKNLRSTLYEANQALLEMRRNITDQVLDTFDTFNEKVQDSYDQFDKYNDILEQYTSIVDLLGVKTDDATRRLIKSLRDTQLQNLRNQSQSAKEIYEGAVANYDLAKRQYDDAVQRYGANSIEAQQMEEILKSAEEARDEAYSNWLDAYQSALEKAREIYEAEMEEITKDFETALAGIYGTFDLFDSAYERAKELKDNYIPEYEKIYELNKLNRDIQKEIDSSNSLRDKKALRQLQEEINRKQAAGIQLSKYEVEEMRKKFELEQARMALEDARNSKSEVRLTRDANGNWGYVYTAAEDKIADAEQKYEDALYNYQQLSDNYINELDEKIKDLTRNTQERIQEVQEALAEGLITEDQAQKQIDNIMNDFYTQQEYLISQFKGATDSLSSSLGLMQELYGQQAELMDTFPETTFGQLTESGNLESWMDTSRKGILKYVEDIIKAYKELQETNRGIAESNQLNLDNINRATQNITSLSAEAQKKVSETTKALADNFSDAIQSLQTFDSTYSSIIGSAVKENEKFISSLNTIIKQLASIASYEMKDLYDQIDYISGKAARGEAITDADWEKLTEISNKYKANYTKELVGFDTGGYTGEWGDEGKMAVLHEKEYVLNADLTARFFDALKTFSMVEQFINQDDLLRQEQIRYEQMTQLSNYIDYLADKMNSANINSNDLGQMMFDSNNQQIDQNVHIEATFPNVTDHNEIEMAFDNLVNKASQYANRKDMSSMTFQDSYLTQF